MTLPAFARPQHPAEYNRPTPFGLAAPLQFTNAVSRKTHTGGGTFDVPLPLAGARGIEPRTGGAGGNHTIVVTFSNPVLNGNAAVTGGTGTVTGPPTFSGNTMAVNLSEVANAQNLTVTLSNVTDNTNQVLPNTAINAGFLQGDSNGDGTVNSGDALQTRNRSGQTTDATNFRSDVNIDGSINSGDVFIVRSRSGTLLPPLRNYCRESFDGVTAPNLPAGWEAYNPVPGNGITWVTSTVTPDTAPNAVFIDDQDGISDKVLDSRNIMILSASAQLSFRNNYNTEYDPPPNEVCWDGGVLEVSSPNINGGAFTDVTDPAVGGGFISGGYTGEISSVRGDVLPRGYMAWCGNSGGYINTVIHFGSNLNGQIIRLRFRMRTDEAASRPGWRIDTLSIMGATCP
ncbi:MAG: dockerin type I domain-containing protein [Verrucomicrobiota bacterium]